MDSTSLHVIEDHDLEQDQDPNDFRARIQIRYSAGKIFFVFPPDPIINTLRENLTNPQPRGYQCFL